MLSCECDVILYVLIGRNTRDSIDGLTNIPKSNT